MMEPLLHHFTMTDHNTVGLLSLMVACSLSFILIFLVATTYRVTQRHNQFSVGFIHSLFLFSVLTSVVTLVIGSSLVRAFGLIGALSIIRFRNALKSPVDAVYIFWALVIGMANGSGFYLLSTVSTVLCSGMALGLQWFRVGESSSVESILKVGLDSSLPVVSEVEKRLGSLGVSYRFLNVLFDSNQNKKTCLYWIRMKKKANPLSILDELKRITGVFEVSCLNHEMPAH